MLARMDQAAEAEADVDLDHIRPDLAEANARWRITRDEARPEAVERRRKRHQRTARENIDDLVDPGTFLEYGAFALAAQRRRRSVEELEKMSVVMVPVALVLDRPWTASPSAGSVAAMVWLGIGPTALATILYFQLIAAAGPTFMAIVNYLSPVVALLAGVLLMGEQPGTTAVAGLLLILLGIALSRRAPLRPA